MGNFKHQSLRDRDKDRDDKDRDARDKDGHERLRHVSVSMNAEYADPHALVP